MSSTQCTVLSIRYRLVSLATDVPLERTSTSHQYCVPLPTSSVCLLITIQAYWQFRDRIVEAETLLARALGFELNSTSAHYFMLNYCRILHCKANSLFVLKCVLMVRV
jgi:hypothetical protein